MHGATQPTFFAKSLLCASLVLAFAVVACTQKDVALNGEDFIQVKPSPLKLPLIPFGASGSGEFILKNISEKIVHINGIGPTSCDCAVISVSRVEDGSTIPTSPRGMNLALEPGQELKVGLELDTARYREPITWKSGRIPVSLGEDGYIGLDFQADIWTPFWVEPWAIKLGDVGVRERPSGYVVVRADEVDDFSIYAPDSIDGWALQVSKEMVGEELRYRIDLTAPSELPEGAFAKHFSLATDIQGAGHIKFAVQGVAHPDLVVSPKRLVFHPQRERNIATLQINASADDLLLPEIPRYELLGIGDENWTVELKEIKKGKRYDLMLTAPSDTQVSTAEIVVRTGLKENAIVRTPIVVLGSSNS